jgi:hypothetical protein
LIENCFPVESAAGIKITPKPQRAGDANFDLRCEKTTAAAPVAFAASHPIPGEFQINILHRHLILFWKALVVSLGG